MPEEPRLQTGGATMSGASPGHGVESEARSLGEVSPRQWRSGIAAWLGWLFDGLDMHLYTLVAAPFVAQLLHVASTADPMVKEKSSLIQASFLVGWALGGAAFGRVGDLMGRSRALSLTILTYATFTGLAFVATTWWQLLIFRFLAALGIGGEWAVGSALLAETWPKAWRPWIAAVLQTGVNIGVLGACVVGYVVAAIAPDLERLLCEWLPAFLLPQHVYPRFVFLAGIVPAFLVFWIRRKVPEPEEWEAARGKAGESKPGIADLFRGEVRRTTLLTIVICASALTAWWAFMFWVPQHFRNLPDLAKVSAERREQLVMTNFFLIIGVSILGNFFAGALARRWGYGRAISIMCLGFWIAMMGTFAVPRGHQAMLGWCPLVGFFSGVFGLFTMYLPPLFPVLLRTTGAGFCYNIGRIVAAAGTVFSGALTSGGDFRTTLYWTGFLMIPAALVALIPPVSTESAVSKRADPAASA